ncbi:MAG: MBL fold metallo-hydrolase [Desulfonatronovibrio sp.]
MHENGHVSSRFWMGWRLDHDKQINQDKPMYIKCWGARGSSPVSGKEFLKYGGNTSCLEIRVGNPEQIFIIDLGSGALPLGRSLMESENIHIHALFTHTHWDHIMGFPLFPLVFVPESSITFYYNPKFQGNPKKLIVQDMMAAPHFPVRIDNLPVTIHYRQIESQFQINELKIKTIPLSHPNLGLGFRLEHQGKSFVFLTDNELGLKHNGGKSTDEYADFCRHADLLIHDSEYFTREEYSKHQGFGHSHAEQVIELALKAGVKSLGLFHHNRKRTDIQIDSFLKTISYNKTDNLNIFAVAQGQEISL